MHSGWSSRGCRSPRSRFRLEPPAANVLCLCAKTVSWHETSHGRRGQSTRSENHRRASGGGGRNYIKTRWATPPLSRARMQYKYVVLTNTTIGTFMAVVDSNIVLISLPTILPDLPRTPTPE